MAQSNANDDEVFSHFSSAGFSVETSDLDAIPAQAEAIVYQIGAEFAPWDGIATASTSAERLDKTAVIHLRLPRAGEGTVFDDDMAVAHQVAEAFIASVARPNCPVLLDTFVDHDRGYFPRHALLDRRCDPRPAYHVLRNLGRLITSQSRIAPRPTPDARSFSVDGPTGAAVLVLPTGAHPLPAEGTVIDLVRGDRATTASTSHRHPLLALPTS